MTKHPARLWIVVLVLGWSLDFLVWGQTTALNFALFTALCLAGGAGVLIAAGLRPALKSLWLLVPYAFFVVMSFARQEPLTVFLAYVFTLVSMGILAVTYLGGRWVRYSLLDYFKNAMLLLGGMLAGGLSFFGQVRKERIERGEPGKKYPIAPILRGLLIAVPVVVCFASLLASADLVFSQKLTDFFDQFKGEQIGDYIWRLFYILLCAYVLAGAILHAGSHSRDEKLLGEDKPIVKPFFGFAESTIVLGSVTLLFLLFVGVQFRYFFGGNANIGVAGYTYSQYARRGFNELVIVAFFSLLMILGLSTITKREGDLQRRIFSGLNVALAILVLIILSSAYQRLELAIDWHGFSRLRVYPQVFLVWVGILFIAVVVLEMLHRERNFALAAILASIGFAVSLSLFNVDDSIVRRNVLRAAQGQHFNPSYLATLSLDAVPALADAFVDPSLSTAVHEGIGAALLCQENSSAMSDVFAAQDWRSFNYSRWNAEQAFHNLQSRLIGYHVNKDRSPTRVRTPGHVLYECEDNVLQ